MKDVNKNFIYNIIYQLFIFIIPLISTPYISRVLGVNNVGIYSYTYSIVYYFMLASLLGINNYGARCISKDSNNKNKMSKNFLSIYFLQLMMTLIMTIIYFGIVVFTNYNHKDIMIIQSLFLLSTAIDINWLFFGIEKFKITISRNIIIKVISLILIFLFVKNNNDLWKYTLIMSGSTIISQAYLWLYIKKYIVFCKISINDIIKNFKPCLILFVPVIAYSIYRVMDKTMIGLLSNTIELGNYESAEKIINIPISFITALGTVMMPHMSKTSPEEFDKKIISTFELCLFFILPMACGLEIISNDFSTIFFGKEFTKAGVIIELLAPTIVFSAIANVIRTSYLIPKELDKLYVKSTIYGAIVNVILNCIFIKRYGALGACIGTIAAEFIVMLYQIIKTRTKIDYKYILGIFSKYLIKALIMSMVVIIIGTLIDNICLKLIVQIIVSILIYSLLSYRYILYDFLNIRNN